MLFSHRDVVDWGERKVIAQHICVFEGPRNIFVSFRPLVILQSTVFLCIPSFIVLKMSTFDHVAEYYSGREAL